MNKKNIIFSLNENYSLAKKIVEKMGMTLSPIKISVFADGEIFCQPLTSVRNKNVYLIHSLFPGVNENIMKLLIAIDALKRSGPEKINIILPYFAYSRQDRKSDGRSPISAKLISDLISRAGATRLTTVELHSEQIQGFFDIPLDHLITNYSIAEYIKKNIDISNLVIVGGDIGAMKKARTLSNLLNLSLAIVDKKRDLPNQSNSINVFGDVKEKDCLIIDDIIDTGGTIIGASKLLKNKGAKKIYICATHGLFNKNAWSLLSEAYDDKFIEAILVTNTIEINVKHKFLKIIDISDFLSEIIKIYIEDKGSISEIYANYTKKISEL